MVAAGCLTWPALLPMLTGWTVRPIDGDTIEMSGEVRLANIDTPETKQARCPQKRAKGEAPAGALAKLLCRGGVTQEKGDPQDGRLVNRHG